MTHVAGFMVNGQALSTAVRHQVPVMIKGFNDGANGRVVASPMINWGTYQT